MRTGTPAEWPTLALIAGCYVFWGLSVLVLPEVSLFAAILLTGVTVALHSSLTHEVIHGHPFPGRPWLNAALVFPTLVLLIPYGRFRDTHLAHHNDADLTDPYDDPESNYLDPAVWDTLPGWLRGLLAFNNTLVGRLLVGPAWSMAVFLEGDIQLMRAGDRAVQAAWLWNTVQAGLVLAVVIASPMPFWAYCLGVYLSMSIVKIRTFLEHQAHDRASGRTAIVEERGPLSWLFLNNNLHVVHHMHPGVPWYALPGLYDRRKDHFVARNGGYVLRSYGEVFSRYLFRRKDPVAHPSYRRG